MMYLIRLIHYSQFIICQFKSWIMTKFLILSDLFIFCFLGAILTKYVRFFGQLIELLKKISLLWEQDVSHIICFDYVNTRVKRLSLPFPQKVLKARVADKLSDPLFSLKVLIKLLVVTKYGTVVVHMCTRNSELGHVVNWVMLCILRWGNEWMDITHIISLNLKG